MTDRTEDVMSVGRQEQVIAMEDDEFNADDEHVSSQMIYSLCKPVLGCTVCCVAVFFIGFIKCDSFVVISTVITVSYRHITLLFNQYLES